jgi:hypothetical protein
VEEIGKLADRAAQHDASKWSLEEWSPETGLGFKQGTAKLAGLEYGSPEYKASLTEMSAAVGHHQMTNDHHPEYFDGDVTRMDLLALIEMLCDWKAAGERHNTGSMFKSLSHNKDRFRIPADVFKMMCGFCYNRGWISNEEHVVLTGKLGN